jgi:hypothetical protein
MRYRYHCQNGVREKNVREVERNTRAVFLANGVLVLSGSIVRRAWPSRR